MVVNCDIYVDDEVGKAIKQLREGLGLDAQIRNNWNNVITMYFQNQYDIPLHYFDLTINSIKEK